MPAQHLPLNTGMIIARYSHGRRPNTQQGSKAQAKIKTLTRHGWRRRGSRLIKSGDKPLRHRSNVLQENVSVGAGSKPDRDGTKPDRETEQNRISVLW